MALPDAIVSPSGCTGSTDVLAGFTCGPGLPGSAAEVLLNWPLLLVRAPILTASGFVSPNGALVVFLAGLDTILVLGVIHPFLLLAGRRSRGGSRAKLARRRMTGCG
jgi:hypothetical protein